MQRQPSYIADRVRWGAITVAASAVLALGTGVVAAEDERFVTSVPATQGGSATVGDCVRQGSSSADQLEAKSRSCQQQIDELLDDPAFRACLDTGHRSADGIERWFDRCRLVVRR